VTRWGFYVVTRPGRKHPYRREEGRVIELTGEVPRDLPLTPTVAAQIDRAYELAIPIGMGENRRTFVGLTEDDLRSLAAAVQRNEVGFAGGRFTRWPVFWYPRHPRRMGGKRRHATPSLAAQAAELRNAMRK
jgi:hypothetical protein